MLTAATVWVGGWRWGMMAGTDHDELLTDMYESPRWYQCEFKNVCYLPEEVGPPKKKAP